MDERAIKGIPSLNRICPSQLKYQIKKIWLKACAWYEQLLNSVPYATVCLYSLYTEQFINYVGWKLTSFFKFNKFQSLKLVSQLGLKFRNVLQLRTEVQFYKAVNMKSSLKFKAFTADTEAIEWEQVIDKLDKSITLNRGQIMLSRNPESHNIL